MIGQIIKKSGKHSLIYSAGSIFGKAIGFVMIPFYTHFLLPVDYGVLELLDLTNFFLGAVVALGLASAIVRLFYDYREERDRCEAVSTGLLFGIGSLAGVYLLLQPLTPWFADQVLGSRAHAYYFHILFASLCFDTVAELALSYVRAKQESVRATLYSLARLVLSLSLNVYFIAVLHQGILGILLSGLISSSALALVLTATTLREVGARFSREKLVAMLRFGLPLVPMSIGMFVLNFSDRFFLQHFSSLTEVGIYSLGYKFGMASGILISAPFMLFWGPYSYEVIQRPDGRELVAKMQVYFTSVLLVCTLGIALVGDPLLRFLSPPAYWEAANVIPIVGLAYVFVGLSYFFRVSLTYMKQTKYLAYAVGASALLNVSLNLVLIPRFHGMGAAWATLLSFCFLAVGLWWMSQRVYALPYEYARIAKLIAASVIVFLASKLFPVTRMAPAVLLDGVCLMVLPLLLHKMGFFEEDELVRARTYARELGRRARLGAEATFAYGRAAKRDR